VPPALFRSRNFTVTNLSTLVMYASVAATFYYLTLFLQGTLGYSAAAAGVATIPAGFFMALFSPAFGALAARYGPRGFLAVGPAAMGAADLWLARLPASSAPWSLNLSDPASFVPPGGYVADVLPGMIAFGVGAMLMVAPLTATLMGSAPVEHAGVASAVNTVISDVGPPLAIAGIFVAATVHFNAVLAAHVGPPAAGSEAALLRLAPFEAPGPAVSETLRAAARAGSAGAFHLAMLTSAALVFCGAVINAIGIQTPVAPAAARVVSPDPFWRRYCHLEHRRGAAGTRAG
jgi:hypothetical protein